MATTKKLDMKKLSLRKKIDMPRPVLSETQKDAIAAEAEQAVNKIHTPKEKEATIRITIDAPMGLYKRIKQKLLDTDIKFINTYVLALINADLTKVAPAETSK